MTRSMKIALILCDHVDEEFLQPYGDYPEMFVNLLRPAIPDLQLVVFDATKGEFPQASTAFSGYLISGSRHGVNDDLPWVVSLEAVIKGLWRAKQKIIGICFGHQLVAKALGGKVITSPKGWGIGMSTNHILQTQRWMQPPKSALNLLISHQDQVVELPEQAQVLAENSHCLYYMLQIDNRILTIQGHPEYNSDYLRALITKRRKKYTSGVYTEAMRSLEKESDNILTAQWIHKFLETPHTG